MLVGMGLLLVATQGQGQEQNPRPAGGDSAALRAAFESLLRGADRVRRDELDRGRQHLFDRLAKRLGVTDGQMTRAQLDQLREMLTDGTAATPGGAPTSATELDAQAEASFRHYDANGDGWLSPDEMPEELREHFGSWDSDGNGLLDLEEYKAYYRARNQSVATQSSQSRYGGTGPTNDYRPPGGSARAGSRDETKAPLIYRSNNLPRELPAWFRTVDSNQDAQISLHEWRRSGRSIAEFQQMDRNGDGFLTVEEVLYYLRQRGELTAGNGSDIRRVDRSRR
jgi:Ca2+-binding EF-hand superfamily protein